VIGISIPSRRARSRKTPAVVRPSTTLADLRQRLRADAPRAISSPARRLRPARVPARDDQVAHAREPGERLRIRAQRLPEPRDLDEPPA
jgi:hypothetical protein